MYGQLIPVGGGPPLPLLEQRLVLGRAPDCDLLIAGKSVSNRHCELELIEGHWWVKDLDSRNGTGLNGKRCTHKRIAPNDVLWVAKQRFRVSYTAPTHTEADEDLAAELLLGDAGSDAASQDTAQQHESSPPKQPPALTPRSPRDNGQTSRPQQTQVLGRLVPCGGGDPIPLLREDLLIGRKSNCDIQLRFTNVSSQHCRLFLEGGYWFVEDLNSRNGIRVEGVRVQRKALTPATVVAIANHRYAIEYTPSGQEPPTEENPFTQSLLVKAGLEKEVDAAIPPDWTNDDDRPERSRRHTLDD